MHVLEHELLKANKPSSTDILKQKKDGGKAEVNQKKRVAGAMGVHRSQSAKHHTTMFYGLELLNSTLE